MTALGTLIQQYLDAHPDVSKQDFAEAAGVSPQLVSGWLNGTRVMRAYPDMVTIQGVADALGVGYFTVLYAITEDLGVLDEPVNLSDRPDVAIHVAALYKLSPERLRAVGRLIADLMED